MANWDLRAHVERDPALYGMATTFTGLFVSHSGDAPASRTPVTRARIASATACFAQQTRDDSYVQALVDRGLVAAADAASHPRRNLITASLSGGERDAVGRASSTTAVDGDRWLLCSDGLSDYVPDAEFAACSRGRPQRRGDGGACASRSHSRPAPATTSRSSCATVVDGCRGMHCAAERGRARGADLLRRCGGRFTEGSSRPDVAQPATVWRTTMTAASNTRGSGPSSFSMRLALAHPVLVAADHLPDAVAELRELEGALGAGVAAGAPAVDDDRHIGVELGAAHARRSAGTACGSHRGCAPAPMPRRRARRRGRTSRRPSGRRRRRRRPSRGRAWRRSRRARLSWLYARRPPGGSAP